jgi:hypothetical protein
MMNQIKYLMAGGARLLRWPLRCALLCLALARVALAVDPLYEIDYPVSYVNNAPNVHATNFVNNATPFEVDFSTSSSGSTLTLFETWNTLNYTNNGTMISDTGFMFDTQITNAFGSTVHLMAANFFNPATISCGSEFAVNATNISMPGGTVTVGGSTTTVIVSGGTGTVTTSAAGSGLISFAGQNVDLSSSTIMLGTGSGGTRGSVAAIPNTASYTYAGFGQDTNVDWDPSISLTASNAYPSLVRMGTVTPAQWYYPFGDGYPQPGLTTPSPLPTTPYQIETDISTNDIIYDYVFVANSDPSVTFNVYMTPKAGNKAGQDTVTVEFVGSYVDPVTGLAANNYLYVTDDYLQGVANNLRLVAATGIPNNFTVTVSSTPMVPAGTNVPPNSTFQPFPTGAITNDYSFVDLECVPTTVPITTVSLYTNNPLAVMPGRILISASSNLDLTFAQISGANYLSVTSSNQMTGSANATISAPYSSFNVGFTNGNLIATNLLEPSVPAWNGYAQAWSTRWINLITNSIITYTNGNVPIATNSYTVTNDYRVAIVANQATPTAPAEVWDLSLHGSNNIVISDVYNILGNLSLNCVGLTLTTNGAGAQSPMGVLNLQGTTESWTAATPNLRYLTNYGDIYLPLTGVNSLGIFGTAATPYGALLNYGLIEDEGSQIWANDFFNSGIFYNGSGSFALHSQTATLTGENAGGYIYAGGDVSITTGSLMVSNLYLEAYRSLTITATNQFTDTGVNNGAIWYVGQSSVGNGIKLLGTPPATGGTAYGNSLLGTTIELFAPANRTIANVWAGADRGASPAGFTNNLAVGMLVLDSLGRNNNTRFTFSGAGVSNALYVDNLYFFDQATNRDSHGNPAALTINSNLVIYYAQAMMNGVSVAQKLDGKLNGHLRWVPTYAGNFSSTYYVYNGVSYAFNAALAQSSDIDSNGNGIPNSVDPMPFFLPGMINPVVISQTNPPLGPMVISWNSIPHATNYVYYSTDNSAGSFTNLLTSFSTNISGPFTMSDFISPIPYPSPAARVMIFDPVTTPSRYYQVVVDPWLTYPF